LFYESTLYEQHSPVGGVTRIPARSSAFCEGDLLVAIHRALLPAHNLVVCRTPRQPAFLGGELQGFFAVELGLADELLDSVGEALSRICLRACVGGSLRPDQERNFAARGALLE